ncbi:MAG: hypothetical protein FWC61_00445 [Proteobacteria bacterium]|nr:hypothetical protein [Pseudomonadota bacterium]
MLNLLSYVTRAPKAFYKDFAEEHPYDGTQSPVSDWNLERYAMGTFGSVCLTVVFLYLIAKSKMTQNQNCLKTACAFREEIDRCNPRNEVVKHLR